MTHKRGTLLVASLVALSLAACGGEATGSDEDGRVDSGFVDITDQQGSVDDFVGAAEDAEVAHCEATSDGWVSAGSVSNPTDETQSYRIYVAFNENRDTKGLVQVDVESVAAGAQAEWRAEAPLTAENLDCVLRVERFAPQG